MPGNFNVVVGLVVDVLLACLVELRFFSKCCVVIPWVFNVAVGLVVDVLLACVVGPRLFPTCCVVIAWEFQYCGDDVANIGLVVVDDLLACVFAPLFCSRWYKQLVQRLLSKSFSFVVSASFLQCSRLVDMSRNS